MAHARQHCNAPMQHTQSTRNERQNELLQPNAQRGEATAQRLPQTGLRKALRAVFRSGAPGRWGGCLGQAINDLDPLGLGHLRRANRVGGQDPPPSGRLTRTAQGLWSSPGRYPRVGLARLFTSDLQLISGQAVSTYRTHRMVRISPPLVLRSSSRSRIT